MGRKGEKTQRRATPPPYVSQRRKNVLTRARLGRWWSKVELAPTETHKQAHTFLIFRLFIVSGFFFTCVRSCADEHCSFFSCLSLSFSLTGWSLHYSILPLLCACVCVWACVNLLWFLFMFLFSVCASLYGHYMSETLVSLVFFSGVELLFLSLLFMCGRKTRLLILAFLP